MKHIDIDRMRARLMYEGGGRIHLRTSMRVIVETRGFRDIPMVRNGRRTKSS